MQSVKYVRGCPVEDFAYIGNFPLTSLGIQCCRNNFLKKSPVFIKWAVKDAVTRSMHFSHRSYCSNNLSIMERSVHAPGRIPSQLLTDGQVINQLFSCYLKSLKEDRQTMLLPVGALTLVCPRILRREKWYWKFSLFCANVSNCFQWSN